MQTTWILAAAVIFGWANARVYVHGPWYMTLPQQSPNLQMMNTITQLTNAFVAKSTAAFQNSFRENGFISFSNKKIAGKSNVVGWVHKLCGRNLKIWFKSTTADVAHMIIKGDAVFTAPGKTEMPFRAVFVKDRDGKVEVQEINFAGVLPPDYPFN